MTDIGIAVIAVISVAFLFLIIACFVWEVEESYMTKTDYDKLVLEQEEKERRQKIEKRRRELRLARDMEIHGQVIERTIKMLRPLASGFKYRMVYMGNTLIGGYRVEVIFNNGTKFLEFSKETTTTNMNLTYKYDKNLFTPEEILNYKLPENMYRKVRN